MRIMKEDLLRIREIAAENGSELTPEQVLQLLRRAKPDLQLKEEPGLVSWIKKHGNNSTG